MKGRGTCPLPLPEIYERKCGQAVISSSAKSSCLRLGREVLEAFEPAAAEVTVDGPAFRLIVLTLLEVVYGLEWSPCFVSRGKAC